MTLIWVGPLMAAAIALYGFQLYYGTYLGLGWVIAAVAGAATAVGLGAAVWIGIRRRGVPSRPLATAWLVLGLISASAIRFPFPTGPYGHVQAFFNVAHAAMLGFETVTGSAILAVMVYVVVRPRSARRWGRGRPDDQQPV